MIGKGIKNPAGAGFTLIEVLVTIAISSIMVITVGLLMFHVQTYSLKSEADFRQATDYRYAKKMMEKELRKTARLGLSNPSSLGFVQIDGSTKTISLNGTRIELTSVGPPNTTLPLLDNVNEFVITSTAAGTAISIYVDTSRVISYDSNQVIRDTHSFIVQLRNIED
ncbi:MAG: prepilin-type N-terminal cleavage/methylation domain-containing protein [Elusimicrobia bacterium]|nr:prepilin-type N-terminal cleavage/methylation domain-containing protein [Elusimicrobiota bacterium]